MRQAVLDTALTFAWMVDFAVLAIIISERLNRRP